MAQSTRPTDQSVTPPVEKVKPDASARGSPAASTETLSPYSDTGGTPTKIGKVAELQKEMAKRKQSEGIVSDVSSLPHGVEPGSGAELEYLKLESKDLKEKLETLRFRRQEDKQKLVEYEKCKIQLQQLQEFRAKMTESHSELQRQLQDARKVTITIPYLSKGCRQNSYPGEQGESC